jgi:transposase
MASGKPGAVQLSRIATRYEKRATNYLAMVTLGMTMLWLT